MVNANIGNAVVPTNDDMTFDEIAKSRGQEAEREGERLRNTGFGAYLEKREVVDRIKAYLSVNSTVASCHLIKQAVPAGTILEHVLGVFDKTTDIPLEIPFYLVQHYISAFLLKKGVTYDWFGKETKPAIWTILLAESGEGKSFTQGLLKKVAGNDIDLFPNPATSASFMETLSDNNNSLWVRDEFAQMLDAMEKQSYMLEMKEYLLKLYDGEHELARRTKKEDIVVENPCLSILGTTVFSTFKNHVTEEMLLDGFAQRFSYVVAKPDPSKKMVAIARTYKPENTKRIKDAWDKISSMTIHKNYTVSQKAEFAFECGFDFLAQNRGSLPKSFFKRITYASSKYALLYHIILGKETSEIDEQDFAWAGRVCALQLQDVQVVLNHYNSSQLAHNVALVEGVMRKFIAKGKTATPRDIVQRVRGIKTVSEAKHLMSIAQP